MTIKERERSLEVKAYQLKKKRQWMRNMKRRLEGSNQEVLSKEQKKEIVRYFEPFVHLTEVTGHEWYTQKTGNFYVNYIPDWVWHGYIDTFYNDIDLAAKMENKCFFQTMFLNCPQPTNLACRANGIWYTNEKGVMSFEEMLGTVSKEKSVFVKVASSAGGFGVTKVDGDQIAQKIAEIVGKISKDIVIQKPIRQSSVLNRINPSSVNTIRVLSLLRPEGVKVYSMALRVGVGGSFVDNACSGGLMVGITPDGKLREKAFFRNGDCCTEHPTTGIRFGDVRLPNIEKVAEFVTALHPQIPYFRLVSWDVVLDENDQPLLLEANLREGGIDIHQLTNGPVFGEDTIKILDEVFKKR